jgi:DNA-binding PadR family transcriptional regulator
MIIGRTKEQILTQFNQGPQYGYDIAKSLNIALSTVYGHLKDFQQEGLITTISDDIENRRKMYELTDKGCKLLDVLMNH